MNEPIVNWGLLGDLDGLRARFNQDPGVSTPTLTISAMGSLMTSESQDTRLTSHPKDGTLPGALGYFFRPEERVPPTGSPTPLPAASGLPSRN